MVIDLQCEVAGFSMKERHLLFDKSMFIKCGKNFGDVKNQDCFMAAWLEEVEL